MGSNLENVPPGTPWGKFDPARLRAVQLRSPHRRRPRSGVTPFRRSRWSAPAWGLSLPRVHVAEELNHPREPGLLIVVEREVATVRALEITICPFGET